MEQKLAALRRLQCIDEQLDQLRARKAHLPERVAAAQGDVSTRESLRDQIQESIRQHRHEIDRQELDLRSREEHTGRLREQLSRAKTNREYQALLTEIKSLEADVSRLEETILEAMGATDELKAELDALAGHIVEAAKEVQEVERTVKEEAAQLDEQIARLEKDRREVADLLDPEHLQVYERLHRGLSRRVVVPVRGELCRGCHMPVMPQTINLLMSNRDLVTCHRCGRILYLDETGEEESAGDEVGG